MSDQTNPDDSRRQRLDEVIGEFLVAQDAGRDQDSNEWLARHPDLCPELAEFFADRERMDVWVEPLRKPLEPTVDVAFSESKADDERGESGALPRCTRVRYFGDYELQHVLGEGGMGIVYKARQLSLNRPVALKMIKAARLARADEVRRFQNESEAVARLDHPNIVPIFEVGQFEDQHYFSMKLIAGESLDKRPRNTSQTQGPLRTGGDRRRCGPPRASARHPPPRFEAGEHPDRCGRAATRHRLRSGKAG